MPCSAASNDTALHGRVDVAIIKQDQRPVLFQRLFFNRADSRPCARGAATQEQRRFRHAVARIKSIALESIRRKCFREQIHGIRAHRFRAVERHRPTGEIQPFALLRDDLANTQVIGKIGCAAGGRLVARDHLQPANRHLCKRHRRHQHAMDSQIHRLQHVTDQPHVMVERQPSCEHGMFIMAECASHHPLVVHEIAMADDDALRAAGRSRRVLQKRVRIVFQCSAHPCLRQQFCFGIRVFSDQHTHVCQARLIDQMKTDIFDQRCARHDQ